MSDNPFEGLVQERITRADIDSTIDEVVDFGWHGDNNFRSLMKETAAHEAHYGELDQTNPMRVDEITYENYEEEPKILPMLKALGANVINGKLDRNDLRTNVVVAGMKYSWNDEIPKGSKQLQVPENQRERYDTYKKLYNTDSGKASWEAFSTSLKKFNMLEPEQSSLSNFLMPNAYADDIKNPFEGLVEKNPFEGLVTQDNPFAGLVENKEQKPFSLADSINSLDEKVGKINEGIKKSIIGLAKAGVRGLESIPEGVGAALNWFGESLSSEKEDSFRRKQMGKYFGQKSVAFDKKLWDKIGNKITEWGATANEFWQKESREGIEAPNPELFRGSFMQNPSWQRAGETIAEGIPSLATATVVGFATKNPIAGAASLGLLEGSQQYIEARKAGVQPQEAGVIGGLSVLGNTVLEIMPITRFIKGGEGKLAKDMFIGAIQEGGEEVLQALWTNSIAKIGYEPTRDLTQGMVEGFIAGAGSGGVLGAFTSGKGIDLDNQLQNAVDSGITPDQLDQMQEAVANQIISKKDEIEEVLSKPPITPTQPPKTPVSKPEVAKTPIVGGEVTPETRAIASESYKQKVTELRQKLPDILQNIKSQGYTIEEDKGADTLAESYSIEKNGESVDYESLSKEGKQLLDTVQNIDEINDKIARLESGEDLSPIEMGMLKMLQAKQPTPTIEPKTPIVEGEKVSIADLETSHPVGRDRGPDTTKGPIEVWKDIDTGKMIVEDGNKRVLNAADRGEKEIDAIITYTKVINKGTDDEYVVTVDKPTPTIEPKDPLIAEAKKYKSAEEFVESQTKLKIDKGLTIQGFDSGKWRKIGVIRDIKDNKVKFYNSSNPKGYQYYEESLDNVNKWIKDGAYRIKEKPEVFKKEQSLFEPSEKEKTKQQLTDIYNKAQEAPKTETIVSTTQTRKEAVQKPLGEGKVKMPKLIQRISDNLISAKESKGMTYNQLDIKKDATLAVDFVNKHSDRAKRISLGRENPPQGITGTSIREAYRLSVEDNPEEYRKVVQAEAMREVRLGQEIAALKEWRTTTDPINFIKTIIAERLKKIAKYDITYETTKAKKGTQKAGELRVRKEVNKAKEVLSPKITKLQNAQRILESIIC